MLTRTMTQHYLDSFRYQDWPASLGEEPIPHVGDRGLLITYEPMEEWQFEIRLSPASHLPIIHCTDPTDPLRQQILLFDLIEFNPDYYFSLEHPAAHPPDRLDVGQVWRNPQDDGQLEITRRVNYTFGCQPPEDDYLDVGLLDLWDADIRRADGTWDGSMFCTLDMLLAHGWQYERTLVNPAGKKESE